ncbi:MAG TPA: cupin domain-containing protein [Pseudolysinimonas sp.]|nr:cupin domain-containing protein [Pseudolysinimonas sp.]
MSDRPLASSRADQRWFDYSEGSQLSPAVTAEGGYPLESMAAGFVRSEAGHRFAWDCPNEETLYIVEGRAEITGNGHTAVAEAGEFIYMPKGVYLEYYFPIETLTVWVASPRSVVEGVVADLEAGEHR